MKPKIRTDIENIQTSLAEKTTLIDDLGLNVRKSTQVHSITEVGYENFDSTTGLQSIIDTGARGRGRNVLLPSGKFNFTKLIIPANINLIGYGKQNGDTNENGTELIWIGENNTDAIITATPELGFGYDFQGSIQNLRVKNGTSNLIGIGIKFRNPQNGAYLKNVQVQGFPTRQVLVYEENATSVGTCPGFAHIDNCFFIGGEIPLEIQSGVEQFNITNTGVDTDVKSICGVLVSPSTFSSQAQRWSCKFDSCKVEIQQSSNDICGIKVTVDAPVTFISTNIQRNDDIVSTKQAILYTNPTGRKLPTIEIINCTSWNLPIMFEATESGMLLLPTSRVTPTSFSYKRNDVLTNFSFIKDTVVANLSGLSINAGYVMPKKGMVLAVTARLSATITVGSISCKVLKNGSTYIDQAFLNTTNQNKFVDVELNNSITSSYHFNAGDRLSIALDSSADLAPTGASVLVCVFVKFY